MVGHQGNKIMSTPEEFAHLMERVRQGSSEAIKEVVERFGSHILAVVRRRLVQELRSKFDSIDFTQDVWASFFAGPQEQIDFPTPESLAAFLAKMAQNKVIEVLRLRLGGKRYNVNRELSLSDPTTGLLERLDTGDPTPSQVVGTEEEWQQLQGAVPEQYQSLLVMLRAGHSYREIARAIGINEKTIRRVVQKLTQDQDRHEPE